MDTTNINKRIYLHRVKPSLVLETTLSTYNLLIYTAGLLFIISLNLPWLESLKVKINLGLIGLGFIIYGVKLTLDAIKSGNALDRFSKSSTYTAARVLNRYTKEIDNSGYRATGMSIGIAIIYHIVVQFYVAGKEYVVDAKVSKGLFEKTAKSKLLKMAYADSNPCMLLFEGEF